MILPKTTIQYLLSRSNQHVRTLSEAGRRHICFRYDDGVPSNPRISIRIFLFIGAEYTNTTTSHSFDIQIHDTGPY